MAARRSTEALVQITNVPSEESAISRYIVGPFVFISFLVSLLMVEQRTHDAVFASPNSRRTRQMDPRDGQVSQHQKALEDFYHSHQRKLARKEFEEAFELRNRVLAGIVLVGGMGIAAISWGWMKMCSVVSKEKAQ